MKKALVFALLMAVTGLTNAQKSSNQDTPISLDEIAAKWEDGSYPSRNNNSGMWEPMPSGKDEIKFNRGSNNKVTSIEIGSTTFKSNATTSSPFVSIYSSGSDRLYLTESTIIMYYDNNTTGESEPKKFWGKKPGSIGSVSKEIGAFHESADKLIKTEESDFAEAEAAAAKKAEEERHAKYCIEDKEVVKIEIVNVKVPDAFGHFRGFDFDIIATLKDGTKISTEGYTQGYISDYKITYSAFNYNGQLASGFVEDDKIVVTATSRYDATMKASAEVTLLYNENVSFNYNGMSWSRGAGESAASYRIEVKQVKHATNGSDLLKIRIFLSGSDTPISEFKMRSDKTLYFFAKGGNGGTDDGTGSNGGDGGDITVIKDPSVTEFNIDYKNHRGSGGSGLTVSANGRDGQDGSFKEEVRKVNM